MLDLKISFIMIAVVASSLNFFARSNYGLDLRSNITRRIVEILSPTVHNAESTLESLQSPRIQIFSTEPLVIYIESFLTDYERTTLLNISQDGFQPSAIGRKTVDAGNRRSRSTYPPRGHELVEQIEHRALAFQGLSTRHRLEPMQVVHYAEGDFFNYHTDWFPNVTATAAHITDELGRNRLSSFFVYLEADCVGGGTRFPFLECPSEASTIDDRFIPRWDKFLDCPEDEIGGVRFKPIPGSAIFWQNLNADGTGRDDTIHGGEEIKSGYKYGLNIWTREKEVVPYQQRKVQD